MIMVFNIWNDNYRYSDFIQSIISIMLGTIIIVTAIIVPHREYTWIHSIQEAKRSIILIRSIIAYRSNITGSYYDLFLNNDHDQRYRSRC